MVNESVRGSGCAGREVVKSGAGVIFVKMYRKKMEGGQCKCYSQQHEDRAESEDGPVDG